MNVPKGEKTKLTKANSGSYSLRTTMPKGIVSQLELKKGDSVFWELHPEKNGKGLQIIVTPSPTTKTKKGRK